MRSIDFEIKSQSHGAWLIVNGFRTINWFCNQPMIMKRHTLTSNESGIFPIDFEVKSLKVNVIVQS